MVTLAHIIKSRRYELDHMSQESLAFKTGLSRQTILSIENRKVEPTLKHAITILDNLGLGLYVAEKGGKYYQIRSSEQL